MAVKVCPKFSSTHCVLPGYELTKQQDSDRQRSSHRCCIVKQRFHISKQWKTTRSPHCARCHFEQRTLEDLKNPKRDCENRQNEFSFTALPPTHWVDKSVQASSSMVWLHWAADKLRHPGIYRRVQGRPKSPIFPTKTSLLRTSNRIYDKQSVDIT